MNNKLNIHKTLATVIGLNMLQIAVMAGYVTYTYILRKNYGYWFDSVSLLLVLIVLTTLINSIYILRDAKHLIKYNDQYEMLKDTFEQVEKLNTVLRAQRHDFINHLQVVYNLIEMEEYNETKNYVERVYSDIIKVSRSIKTASPAINALLQAKILYCEKRDIKVLLNVSSQLNDLKIPAWEMCRVLGNLIDNAIYALARIESNKIININITENPDYNIFTIEDNGEMIEPENLKKIFQPGFTTKGKKGEGLGLAISKEIINTYGGNIDLESSKEKTVFTVKIPRLMS